MPVLERLPWFLELIDYLKTSEDDLWEWFSKGVERENQAEAVRLDLLKTTYRIDCDANRELYQAANDAADRLGIDAPLTIYQAQQAPDLNAALKFVPGEVHVVLQGPLLETLDEGELRALLGHELSHYVLWTEWDQELLIAHEILRGMLNDPRGDEVHVETFRRMRLFSEVFCDRGSLLVSGDLHTAVGTLVKMQTGLKTVDPESYLQQAEEAVLGTRETTGADAVTEGFSHPEAFLRVRALQLWSQHREQSGLPEAESTSDGPSGTSPEVAIRGMIEGPLSLNQIDLPGQRRLTDATRKLIAEILQPAWLRTEVVLSHARLFFSDIDQSLDVAQDDSALDGRSAVTVLLQSGDDTIVRYVCGILLDFTTADRDIQEATLAAAIQKSVEWDIADAFGDFAIKELKLRKKQFKSISENADSLIAAATRS